MKLKLLLTFDHELPLGGVHTSYKEAMFDPTYRLFQLAGGLEVPVVLFTDVLCGIKYEGWDNSSFYRPYVKQLKKAILQHHDVQLHLHPHWLTSSFENNSFIPSRDYRLADFKDNKTYSIDNIIKTGIDFLRKFAWRQTRIINVLHLGREVIILKKLHRKLLLRFIKMEFGLTAQLVKDITSGQVFQK